MWRNHNPQWGGCFLAINKVLTYTLSDQAQAMAPGLGFISLPPGVLAQGRAALATIKP